MLKIKRDVPKKEVEKTAEERVKKLEQEVETLKQALDDILLSGSDL